MLIPRMMMAQEYPVSKAVMSVADTWASGSNTNTYVRSGLVLGDPAADRVIYIVCGAARSGATPSTPTVTLGGNAMDLVVRMDNGGGWWIDIYKLVIPAGTSATFLYSFSGTEAQHFFMTAYRVTGMVGEVGYINTVPASGTIYSVIPVVKNGFVLGGGTIFNSSEINWDGVVKDYTVYIDGQRRCESASIQAASSQDDYEIRGRVGFSDPLIAQAFVSIY